MSGFLMKMNRLPWQAIVPVTLLSVVLAGCGKSGATGSVKGKVLLNDTPYADATVVFISPDTGQGASADIQADGTFLLEAPLQVGSYTVYLEPKPVTPESIDPASGGFESAGSEMDDAVPAKYWDEGASDISKEIVEGENDITIELKK